MGDESVGTNRSRSISRGTLIWVAVIAGLFFMIVHALYMIMVRPPKRFAEREALKLQLWEFRSAFRGTRWRRGCFTGSWRRRCSRC